MSRFPFLELPTLRAFQIREKLAHHCNIFKGEENTIQTKGHA
jgi:hypothetical protein